MKSKNYSGMFSAALMLLILTLALMVRPSAPANAQPGASELADRLERVTAERIQGIDRLQITNRIISGMFEGEETTSHFVKVRRNGKYVLESIDHDEMYDTGELSGFSDEIFAEMIRNASVIAHDTFEGHRVYRIVVDDADYLKQWDGYADWVDDEYDDEYEDESVPESVTLWLDRDELLVRQLFFEFAGEEVAIRYRFSDYQYHSGLPIPMVTEFEVEGLDQLVSEEDIAEARRAMREMEQQLEHLPEAQREMIMQHMQPQMERFEKMIESGDMGKARIEVIDVVVN